MEHIVQFAVGIDDEAIKKRVEEYAYDDIVKHLVKQCEDELQSKGYRGAGYRKTTDWYNFAANNMQNFLETHKAEIIDAAADKLCDSIKRTKKFKEKDGRSYGGVNKMRKEILAVDFDGTLCESQWPGIGEPCYDIINWIKELREVGYKVILWTCRDGDRLDEAVAWCAKHGLFFDAINDNVSESKAHFGDNPRKIFADYYIDDKAINPTDIRFVIERRTRNG